MLSDSVVYPSLPAKDMARAKAFYQDKLGLNLKEEDEAGIFFECAQNTGLYVYPSEYAGTNQATAAGWYVSDLASAMVELRAKGVEFENYDLPYLKTENGLAELGDFKAAWLKDSEGNILALTERSSK